MTLQLKSSQAMDDTKSLSKYICAQSLMDSVRKKATLGFPLDRGPVSGCSLFTVPFGITGLRRGDDT